MFLYAQKRRAYYPALSGSARLHGVAAAQPVETLRFEGAPERDARAHHEEGAGCTRACIAAIGRLRKTHGGSQ